MTAAEMNARSRVAVMLARQSHSCSITHRHTDTRAHSPRRKACVSCVCKGGGGQIEVKKCVCAVVVVMVGVLVPFWEEGKAVKIKQTHPLRFWVV